MPWRRWARWGPVSLCLSVPGVSSGQAAKQVVVSPTRWILAYAGWPREGRSTYTVDDFVRLLAVVDTGGQPLGWLNTGVLFLQIYATSGRGLYPGFGATLANGADWQQYVDSLMANDAAVARLDSAVGLIATRLKGGPKPFPVAVMIPYPDPGAGIITFGNNAYVMNTAAGRLGLATAYTERVRSAFVKGRHGHLHFDAFYWFRENCPPADTLLLHQVARVVHAAGLRFLWIPYYRAMGFDHWRSLGFDEAWLQPNYFFHLDVPPAVPGPSRSVPGIAGRASRPARPLRRGL